MNLKKISLYPEFFSEQEREFCLLNNLKASVFRYPTGVCGLKLSNINGYVILLPFQGQQIWRAEFLNHPLTMKTAIDMPKKTDDFLKTYGGFLLHCGITSMGNPSESDQHPQHGELPNASYDNAWIHIGEDEGGAFLELSGELHYQSAFEADYTFVPAVRLYENATTIQITVHLQNNRHSQLEYYYLCHINFKPVDGAELFYTADKNKVKVHHDLPEHFCKKEELKSYMERLDENIALHHKIGAEGQIYEPEIVFTIEYKEDQDGKAHTMQVLPDGFGCYVSHHPSELPLGLRWISRTDDEDALGMVLPTTAEHKGLKYCRENGFDRYLKAGEKKTFHMEVGILSIEQTNKMKEHIKLI